MPLPNDKTKHAEYRIKMSQSMRLKWSTDSDFARRVSIGHKGLKPNAATLEKMSRAQKKIGNSPEERLRRSERAKQLGYGKWMKGRKAYPQFVAQSRARKGKTYIEIYGSKERAEEELRKRSEGNKRVILTRKWKTKAQLQSEINKTIALRKGKTYKDIYGS